MKNKKIGIVGILQNPSKRTSSHNAGWTYVLKSMLDTKYETECDVLNQNDDWNDYHILYITEGVNFREGQWNLFGGVSDQLLQRINKINDYEGDVFYYGDFVPHYAELCEKRNIDLVFHKVISFKNSILKSNKIVLGDSHTISVYDEGFDINRRDGKTLNSYLKEGVHRYILERHDHLRFYAGNIDVRHHVGRIYSGFEAVDEMRRLAKDLCNQVYFLINKGTVKKVELVELLPIESEDRKIPGTGKYMNKNFWGSWEDRSRLVDTFNRSINEMVEVLRDVHHMDVSVLKWRGLRNEKNELDQSFMEAKSSVHLAPHSYMFSFINEYKPKKEIKVKAVKEKVVDEKKIIKKRSFSINQDVLYAIDDYHKKSLMMQRFYFEGNQEELTLDDLESTVKDPLIFNVPIYDMLDRKYAAFSSFLEAIMRPREDSKGNSKYFPDCTQMKLFDKLLLFYLFRLCGSGINYKPKEAGESPYGTHGFGNFWIVDLIKNNILDNEGWLKSLEDYEGPFTNNKGYMLPQISYKDQNSNHLKRFILEESVSIVKHFQKFSEDNDVITIIEGVEHMNSYLKEKGFKNQNFVMSAFMADVAEYFPYIVDPKSMIYAGSNAKKCIKAIFNKEKGVNQLQFESDCIQFLADRYNSVPYSVEDSRLCDVIRYFQQYQSKHHIEANGNKIYKNNSSLKYALGKEEYEKFVSVLK